MEVRWGYLFIFLFVLAIIALIVYYSKKYKYQGISDDNVILDFIRYFKKDKTKKKKRENKTENKCREILENIFNTEFKSIRPSWLKSPKTGMNLELDCFNEELGLALEYNGKQHYAYTPYFHKSKKDFYAQVHRDDWKRRKCQERGITLIEIPYWVTEVDLEKYIERELKKKGF